MDKNSSALKMDLYELTMAVGYFKKNADLRATFELFCRQSRSKRSYFIACGLEQALDYLLNLRFSNEDISYLKNKTVLKSAGKEFFEYLRNFKFTGDVWAMPEGTPFFPFEPILQVKAPIIEAQIVETYLLSIVHIQTLVASKASRIVRAARSDGKIREVVDFGARRAHGPDAAILAARAAYIAGCAGTSNVFAGMKFNIPTYGTMAHSWIQVFDNEEEAFRNYNGLFPKKTILLIDTYDTLKAAKIVIGLNKQVQGVRLDSGDLSSLSKRVRRILDSAGLKRVSIIASGNLDEYKIIKLVKSKAPIDVFGVGTEMVTSGDRPYIDLVYKLVEIESAQGGVKYTAKSSKGKRTIAGRKQVYRYYKAAGVYLKDIISLAEEKPLKRGQAMLEQVVKDGRLIKKMPAIDQIRKYAQTEISRLPGYCNEITSGRYLNRDISSGLKAVMSKPGFYPASKALLIADPQNDFCPAGKLAVPEGDKIIPAVNKYIKYFSQKRLPIFITRDWHPKKTKHFKKFGGRWPEHCLQNSRGAEFHPGLKLTKQAVIMSKGMDPFQDSYSAFDSLDSKHRRLADLLKMLDVEELYIGGLATDYCVKFSALDALKAGFKVKILADAIKGVDLKPGDSQRALKELARRGAKTITISELKTQRFGKNGFGKSA